VNLAIRNQRPRLAAVAGAERQQKQPPVLFNVFSSIFLGEAEVERPAFVTIGGPAGTSAEPVDQPGDLAEVRRPQHL